jgi:hypothetical protein
MKRRDLEGPIQRAIIDYLRRVIPNSIVHHSANEGVRGGAAGYFDGAKRKGMGQVAGFPDIILIMPAHIGTVYFEVKAPGGKVSAAQDECHDRLKALGYRVGVVQSIDDVRDCLAEWAIWTSDRSPRKSTAPGVIQGP